MDQRTAPAEPRLQAVLSELLPRGVTGKELSNLEDTWLPLLHPFPWGAAQVEAVRLRGRILFGIGARLLGASSIEAEAAGSLWSLIDVSTRCSDGASRTLLQREAEKALGQTPLRVPRNVRPLTTIAALATANLFRGGGGVARLKAAMSHRLMGRFPRG